MTDEELAAGEERESQQRRRLHATAKEQLLERQFSNSESYDKAILTLSSAFLGLSLTFIKGILPAGTPAVPYLLYLSWGVLALAIVTTVVSFRVSDAALAQALNQIERYYLQRDESAAERTGLAKAVDWFNNVAGALFIGGVLLTVVFVAVNFPEATRMSQKSGSGPTRIDEGQTVPTVQRVMTVPLKKGQSIPQIQPVVPPAPAANQAKPPATPPPTPAPGTRPPDPSVPKK